MGRVDEERGDVSVPIGCPEPAGSRAKDFGCSISGFGDGLSPGVEGDLLLRWAGPRGDVASKLVAR